MLTRNRIPVTAIFMMAVLFVGALLSGCCTPRHIDELRMQVEEVQRQNTQVVQALTKLDTLSTQESDNNRRLRTDVSMTVDQLEQQISALQESYQDMLQKIDAIYRAVHEKRVLRGSTSAGNVTPAATPGQPPEVPGTVTSDDCYKAYDDAFIIIRGHEYEKAVEAFKAFIRDCEKHELVENAHYWIGEAYYSLEQFDDAVGEFEFLLENYGSSVNTSRALYKLGRSRQELGKKAEAKEAFQKLIDEHGGTLEAEQAKERLKELK